jgi:hypothetical protein
VYRDTYVVVAASSRISSFDGSNWKKYDGTGSGTGPYDNGNVVDPVGAYVVKPRIYGMNLVFASGATIGSWDGTNFKNYDGSGSGTGPRNANVGFTITAMCLDWNNNLVVGGVGGKIASFDGTNWKYSGGTGTGTGPYDDGTIVGNQDVHSLVLVNNIVFVFATTGSNCRFGNINASGTRNYDGTGAGNSFYSGSGKDNFFLGASAGLKAVVVAVQQATSNNLSTQAGIYMIGNYERIANLNVADGMTSSKSYQGTSWSA